MHTNSNVLPGESNSRNCAAKEGIISITNPMEPIITPSTANFITFSLNSIFPISNTHVVTVETKVQ
jgi:hypothetical protein